MIVYYLHRSLESPWMCSLSAKLGKFCGLLSVKQKSKEGPVIDYLQRSHKLCRSFIIRRESKEVLELLSICKETGMVVRLFIIRDMILENV